MPMRWPRSSACSPSPGVQGPLDQDHVAARCKVEPMPPLRSGDAAVRFSAGLKPIHLSWRFAASAAVIKAPLPNAAATARRRPNAGTRPGLLALQTIPATSPGCGQFGTGSPIWRRAVTCQAIRRRGAPRRGRPNGGVFTLALQQVWNPCLPLCSVHRAEIGAVWGEFQAVLLAANA